jgi:hypothetical protein
MILASKSPREDFECLGPWQATVCLDAAKPLLEMERE